MNPATQAVIDKLLAAIRREEPAFALEGALKTSVLENGTYKTRPLTGGDEFILKGVRTGARGNFILEFVPFDDKPYTQMELSKPSQFEQFTGLEYFLVTALGFEDGDSVPDWNEAVKIFMADFEESTRKESVEANQDNPMWGMFG
jgi:hypothetical protein